jgi:hypothetical protein
MDLMSWWAELDISTKSEVIMLVIVFGSVVGSVLFMAIASFVETLKSRPQPQKVHRAKLIYTPNIVIMGHRKQNKLVEGFVNFFNWYFKVLGI